MLTEHTFDTGTVIINYAEGGSVRPPLVLLHGGSTRWQSSLPIIPELSRRWHLYAPDLRGHGKSGRTPGRYRLEDYVADITAFLQQVVKQPAVLFGHSLGGHIAIMVAAQYPQWVKALMIGDAPFDQAKLRAYLKQQQERLEYWRDFAGPDHSHEERLEAMKNMPIAVDGQSGPVPARTLFGEENPWFAEMAENLHLNDPAMLDAVIEFDKMHAGYDYERLFPMISCPALIIQGSPAHGGMLTDEEVARALALLPCASVARMQAVGHPLHTQEKEPVLAAMLAFLEGLEA